MKIVGINHTAKMTVGRQKVKKGHIFKKKLSLINRLKYEIKKFIFLNLQLPLKNKTRKRIFFVMLPVPIFAAMLTFLGDISNEKTLKGAKIILNMKGDNQNIGPICKVFLRNLDMDVIDSSKIQSYSNLRVSAKCDEDAKISVAIVNEENKPLDFSLNSELLADSEMVIDKVLEINREAHKVIISTGTISYQNVWEFVSDKNCRFYHIR